MCEAHKNAFSAMRGFIYQTRGRTFTLWELENYVIRIAKTTRIAPGRDIRDWLEDAKLRGEIKEVAPFEYKWDI